MKIYKYSIDFGNKTKIMVPALSRVLTAQLQHNKPVVWIALGDGVDKWEFQFQTYITGQHQREYEYGDYIYISTIQWGGFVGHVYYTLHVDEENKNG